MFGLSALLTLAALVAYVVIPVDEEIALPLIGDTLASNVALGLTFGLAITLIGIGAIHWAKKLMVDTEVVAARHSASREPADRAAALEVFDAGAEEFGFGQRKTSAGLIGAMALFPLPLVFFFRDPWITPHPATGQPVSPSEKSAPRFREAPCVSPTRRRDPA
jgi:ubiquinol-cytochrome c reductase iron-sulfur subunit